MSQGIPARWTQTTAFEAGESTAATVSAVMFWLSRSTSANTGVAPTANIDPERRFPSMFEPIHGSAFDITGKGIANPVATFWTASQMLDHLGEAEASARLMRAVEKVCAEGILTPDVGGTATTKEVTEAVCEAIRGENI